MTKINICGRLTCHGHSPGGQVTPPTILPWAVVFFFASTGIVPQGYFTGKKKKKRVTSVISSHWIHSKPSQTDSYEHLQWSFLSWKTGSWCGSMGSQKSPKAAQQACSFFCLPTARYGFILTYSYTATMSSAMSLSLLLFGSSLILPNFTYQSEVLL